MGLRFIYGRSGVGKTKYLRDWVIDSAVKNTKINYCIMVPEQSNLQTQKDYVLSHPDGGILNIDVLSFKRLAYRIFSEVGGFNNRVLDESGKLMVLKKLVNKNSDMLGMLQKPLRRIDSIAKLKSILSEFAQYHVTRDSLADVIEEDKIPGLSGKLKDLSLLQEAFSEYISGEYITDEQIMDVLVDRIEHSEFVKNTVFVFDDYTGFTYLQNEVLRKLLIHSADVIVALTMDISYVRKTVVPAHDLFALSVNTKTELTNIAVEEKVKIHDPVLLTNDNANTNPEFDFLERNLFEYSQTTYSDKTTNILICKASSPEKEVLYLRNTILKLVREEEYSYKDIAVVTGDLGKYGVYFKKLFNDAHIPCFVDDSRALLNNSVLEAIRALIKICIEDFSYKSVFNYLRNNLSTLTSDEIDILENYVIAKGIRSFSVWSTQWKRCVEKQSEEQLLEINRIRENFILELKEFVHVMRNKNSTIKDKAYSLYSFLADINMEGKLLSMSEFFEISGDDIRAVEYRQVYGAVIRLLDELVEIMGDECVSAEEFLDILDAGFSAIKIGVLPPGTDYVLLGDVERTRFAKTKVLFLLGANEGIIPKKNEQIGFINESERLLIKEAGVRLAPTSHEEYYTQRYYLYRMLTKATERLFVCYSGYGEDGEESLPSYIVKNVIATFPQCLKVDFNDIDIPETNAEVYEHILTNRYKNEHLKEKMYAYLLSKNEYKKRLDMYQKGVLYKGEETSLSEKLSEKLFLNYNSEFVTSVSRLETYAKCPFSHFLSYGLKINDRVKPEMTFLDYGNIYHYALESFVVKIKQMNLRITEVGDETSAALAENCINEAYEKVYRAYREPSARDKYHIKTMIRLMNRTIWVMKKQFSEADFSISSAELLFNSENCKYNLPLNENMKVYLNGKIDRIDTFIDGDKEYIRIIDYKSGSTSFSLLKFYHGLQLQLIVYLDVAASIYSEAHSTSVSPAGAFYYNINDPVVDIKNPTDDRVEEAIMKKLKLSGYQNAILPEFTDKKLGEEMLELMINHGRNKVVQLSDELLSGNIEKRPYSLMDGGIKEACNECNYKKVCGYDKTLPWCADRVLEKYNETEILGRLKESEDADNEMD